MVLLVAVLAVEGLGVLIGVGLVNTLGLYCRGTSLLTRREVGRNLVTSAATFLICGCADMMGWGLEGSVGGGTLGMGLMTADEWK